MGRSRSGDGAPGGIRTHDPRFRRPMLYPLSYGRGMEEAKLACKLIVARGRMALILLCLAALAVVGCSNGAPPTPAAAAPASGNLLTPVPVLPDASPLASAPEEDQATRQRRQRMVDEDIAARGVLDSAVLLSMATVPRHRLVLDQHFSKAYDDHPLPIGHGQTISQPYTVALMTELLDLGPGDKVLEVGTGSGYQAAVLAEMGVEVHTIEIIPELAQRAANDLLALGYGDVRGVSRRRLLRTAGAGPLRSHHRHRGARPRSGAPGRPARAHRPHGRAGRAAGQYSDAVAHRVPGR